MRRMHHRSRNLPMSERLHRIGFRDRIQIGNNFFYLCKRKNSYSAMIVILGFHYHFERERERGKE